MKRETKMMFAKGVNVTNYNLNDMWVLKSIPHQQQHNNQAFTQTCSCIAVVGSSAADGRWCWKKTSSVS